MSTELLDSDCPICHGVLSVEVKVPGGYRIDPCRCATMQQVQDSLATACIPKKYRDWDLRNLRKSFREKNSEVILAIKKYAENITKNIKNGNSFWISAPSGLNKNAFICYVLKEALAKSFRAKYSKASTLINKKLDSWKDIDAKKFMRRFVDYSDIVAITDIEKINTNGPNDIRLYNFYEIMSDLDDNRTALLVSSNMPKENVVKKMPMFMRQRLRPIKELVLRYPYNIDEEC